MVSYSLKQDRFTSLHRKALRWPETAFHFIGNQIPAAAKGAQEGEQRTVAAFEEVRGGGGGGGQDDGVRAGRRACVCVEGGGTLVIIWMAVRTRWVYDR